MAEMGLATDTVRAGHSNRFLSPLFREAFVNLTGARLELYNTDGSQGAARAAGDGAGIYTRQSEAVDGLQKSRTLAPDQEKRKEYLDTLQSRMKTLPSST